VARPLRLESESGVYHVLNRGNYRVDIFRADKTKAAFLKCLQESCERTGWQVHAWCIMSNHYHLAISTPRANLAEGMTWMQGTFATRFNRIRKEHGHLFQGRYKSLIVDPDDGLGPLCHYIHLNPVRAGICKTGGLPAYLWSSMRWLAEPKSRPGWYDPGPTFEHAGNLADTTAGRRKYLEYLEWLAEDDTAMNMLRFEQMSKGWVIGTKAFAKEMIRENHELAGHGRRLARELRESREAIWEDELASLMRKLGRKTLELRKSGKSEDWKLAIAAELKARTTVTNRWLATTLHMGNLYEVSRKVAAWSRDPDVALRSKLK
jgi:putative transposase